MNNKTQQTPTSSHHSTNQPIIGKQPRFWVIGLVAVSFATLTSGCAVFQHKIKQQPPPKNVTVGTVAQVDMQYDFVVIDIGGEPAIESGSTLFLQRADKEVGKVKVGTQSLRPFVVADILDGEPMPGDIVLR